MTDSATGGEVTADDVAATVQDPVSIDASAPRDGSGGNGAGPSKGGTREAQRILPGLVNCQREDDEELQALADREGVALAAFIAPYVQVKVSPVQQVSASIGLLEEFGAEELVQEFHEHGITKAYLLINSFGGGMDSSYKIARAVRTSVGDITTFVPHIAASGGTLLALTGNRIVMGRMSHLTPLDVQLGYLGNVVSAGSAPRFFQRAVDWFKTTTPEEAPYPQRALVDKMDGYIMEEWSGLMSAMVDYVTEVLTLSGYGTNSAPIAEKLVSGYSTHSYVINDTRARDIGLSIQDSSDVGATWDLMRRWLSKYAVQQEMTHLIRYVIPGSSPRLEEARGEDDDAGTTQREPRAQP